MKWKLFFIPHLIFELVLFNGFQKKTQKTPKKEIEKAERIMKEYFKEEKINKMKTKSIKTFDQHLEERYGKIGTEKRTEFEIKAKSFAIGELNYKKEENKQI